MKKIYFTLALAFIICLSFTNTQAQTQTQQKTGDWTFEVGPNLAIPIRNLSYFTSFGIGADALANTSITNELAVGARANYTYFIGKTPLLATESHGASIVNLLGDANYTFPQKIFVGIDLGVGFETTNGQSDTEFARVFNVGYKWDQSKEHTYIFTLYFDQTTYEKCLGLRAAIRL